MKQEDWRVSVGMRLRNIVLGVQETVLRLYTNVNMRTYLVDEPSSVPFVGHSDCHDDHEALETSAA